MLEDGCTVCFGPADKGHFKYIFHEHYSPPPNGSPSYYAKPLSPPAYVDPSGYDSVATQDVNSNRSSPLEHSHQVELYRSEISRLKVKTAELETQLKQQLDYNKLISNDVRVAQRVLAEKESKYRKKIDNLKSIMNKYRTLIGQLESSSQSQGSRCNSSDDESGSERACNESHFGGHAAVSSVLREITCSICSEYLVSPTSLNCSHVFCLHCIEAWKKEYRSKYNSVSNGICPVCRKEVQFQTQPLAFENLINILLENVLDRCELEERRKLVEARKKQSLASANSNSSSSSSLGSFLTQILNNLPRSRRPSIVIQSDDSDDDNEEDQDDAYSVDDHDDDDVVEIDYNEESGQVEVNLDLSDLPSDEDEEIDISITLSSGGNALQVLGDSDSGDEILMIEDEDSNSSQSDIFYYLDESESASEPIVISDSEEEPNSAGNRRRRRRRSSMIIISDSEDSIPVRRNNLQRSNEPSRSGSNVTTSTTESSSSGFITGLTAPASGSRHRNGSRQSHSSRRAHPYQRAERANSSAGNSNTANRRLSVVCV